MIITGQKGLVASKRSKEYSWVRRAETLGQKCFPFKKGVQQLERAPDLALNRLKIPNQQQAALLEAQKVS